MLTPNDAVDLDDTAARLTAFEQPAEPFEWKFTRHDLDLQRRESTGVGGAACTLSRARSSARWSK